ncbi:MAG: type VI secretion system protein TssA [Deltaproteobacteria bacterium]|jgi:type VI secretion system protein VasJ|nr:type VI secretion system protein TssA [Deltaproteobacteria bacterium]
MDFSTLGTNPVAGPSPSGADASYEPEYTDILAEIGKLSFSGQGTAVSWPLVEQNAVLILSGKSKDIQIAAYLAVALLHNRGLEGLPDGLRLLSGLLGTFWETAWPPVKRMRGRINALYWWRERTQAFLQEQAGQNAGIPADLRDRILEALAGLDKTIAALLPDFTPLKEMAALVGRLGPSNSGDKPAPRELAQPAQASPQASPPAPPSDDPAVLRQRFVAAGREYLIRAMRLEPANASLWRLSRLVLWSGITALPQAEGNRTLLPVPDAASLNLARQKSEAGNALEAAFAAEEFMATAPFCLDAQMVIFKALSTLGPQFAEAAQAVRDESGRFAARLPGLEKLSFNDGAPFASPQTAVWLAGFSGQNRVAAEKEKPEYERSENVLERSENVVERSENALARSENAAERALAAARALLAQNRLPEALDALDAAKTDSPATNMRFRIAQLGLLCEGGAAATALALAETLLADSSARDLDNWDPGLALEALTAAHRAFLLFDAQNQETLSGTLSRITRIKPSAALG